MTETPHEETHAEDPGVEQTTNGDDAGETETEVVDPGQPVADLEEE